MTPVGPVVQDSPVIMSPIHLGLLQVIFHSLAFLYFSDVSLENNIDTVTILLGVHRINIAKCLELIYFNSMKTYFRQIRCVTDLSRESLYFARMMRIIIFSISFSSPSKSATEMT